MHFNKNQRLSRDKIEELQNKKLQIIVRHAYETTLFYRRLMDQACVKPEDIESVSDLQKIPPITKSQIQEDYTSFISNRYKTSDCYMRTTSGSSGTMLRVLWDKDNFWIRVFLYYRTFAMIGYNPFKKALYFLPVAEDTGFSFGLFRQLGLSLGISFEEVRDILLKYKPHILSIYPSYAIDLGRHLTEKDIDLIGIEAISLNSEMILPYEVAIIEKRFRCPVYNEYSSVETGMIASMCQEKGMHIFTDNVVLEILDTEGMPSKYGDRGEVVLTALNSFALPFIRYRIGDYSRLLEGECSCGRPFPLLGDIEGRKDDSFRLKDGRQVPAWQIYEIVERPMEEFGMEKLILSDFYLVQKDCDLAEFFYVRGPDFKQSYIDELRQKAKRLFGNEFTFHIQERQNIERMKTVKRKYIHCEL